MNRPVSHNMYYLAIVCPGDINKKVQQFKQWMKDHFGCVVAMKSPAHITVIPPFWLVYEREIELMATLQLFNSNFTPGNIDLDGFSHFRKRVLFIQIKESDWLSELHSRAEKHFMQKFGDCIKKDDRPFHPHVTIANRDMKPAHFEKAWEHFHNEEFNSSFDAGAISLLRLGPGTWNVVA